MAARNREWSSAVSDTDPGLKFPFRELVRLETELWNAVEGRLHSDHGVTLPLFEAMQTISVRPDCRVQDIAAALAITVGGTSKIVDRVEAAGYCTRQANPSDRRSSIILLTPVGQRLLPKLTATVDDELRLRLSSRLSERSLTQLTRTLSKLRTAMHSGERAVSA